MQCYLFDFKVNVGSQIENHENAAKLNRNHGVGITKNLKGGIGITKIWKVESERFRFFRKDLVQPQLEIQKRKDLQKTLPGP